ncbi:MAG: riboflavin synthase [Deltaproteobacteria bacterium]|nr:riboflavin synthase [Deltaproteobacteria bacterium]
MFTGLTESCARVLSLLPPDQSPAGMHLLTLEIPAFTAATGDSISINGCCLTVSRHSHPIMEFDISAETLSCTCLKELRPGSLVNVERALQLSSRLGGHLVSGHIDEAGQVLISEAQPEGYLLELMVSPAAAPLLIPKGSIAINGVSLTINRVQDTDQGVRISMMLIPETLRMTNLGRQKPGDLVNVEFDQTGKFIWRQQQLLRSSQPPLPS